MGFDARVGAVSNYWKWRAEALRLLSIAVIWMNVTHWRRSVTICFSCDSSYLIVNIFRISLIVFIPQFRPLCPNLTLIGRWVWVYRSKVQILGKMLDIKSCAMCVKFAFKLLPLCTSWLLLLDIGTKIQISCYGSSMVMSAGSAFFSRRLQSIHTWRSMSSTVNPQSLSFLPLVHLCVTVYCNLPW